MIDKGSETNRPLVTKMKKNFFGGIQMKQNKTIFLDKITNYFEIGIAVLLLVVVAMKVVEIGGALFGVELIFLKMDFDGIMSVSLTLVVCVEFIKMLYRHNYETVIHVLLFAIARQMIVYHEGMFDMLIGVVAIIGLFAAKKFLIGKYSEEKKPSISEWTGIKRRKPPKDK